MRVTFAFKEFLVGKRNLVQPNHFLLTQARVEVTLIFEDSTEKVFVPPKGTNGKFVVDIGPLDVPDSTTASAPPLKKRLSMLALDFTVPYTHAGNTYQLLRIMQDFSLTPLPTNSDHNIDYALSPFSWKHGGFSLTNRRTSANRTANARVHPLLDLSRLSRNLVLMNVLILDLSELWAFLHHDNPYYITHRVLSFPDKVTLKVFAHTGGNAFIWYAVVPSYAVESTEISPHVFFSPADFGELQNKRDERVYLSQSNMEHFAYQSGATLIDGYLLPPIDDARIQEISPPRELEGKLLPTFSNRTRDPQRLDRLGGLNAAIDQQNEMLLREGLKAQLQRRWTEWLARTRRNVVPFYRGEKPRREITPAHWSIGAGFERAFYGLGKVKPQQLLVMPQIIETERGARRGSEITNHLKDVTDTIVDVLQTQTQLLLTAEKDEFVTKGKMVLSCYSASGPDLWTASRNNIAHVKAIIGIEPNETFKTGTKVVPDLLARKIRVFIIGRHRGGPKGIDLFRPNIPPNLQRKIDFLPTDLRIMKYPPDPNSNDFVKFRMARVTDVNLDPLMHESEKEILNELANQRKPKTGEKAIPEIFKPLNDSDDLRNNNRTTIMYRHHFALTGGQRMTLVDPNDPYKKGIKEYWTFFQHAVEEIG